ncbi:MAG: ABC transporter substrate-binding protein [Microbacteriaceae bacterium]
MPLVVQTNRRRIATVVAGMLTAMLAFTGCATTTDEPAGESSSSADSLLPEAEGKTEYPLTLTSPWGETVLEERPERIAAVVADGGDSELLATLGVTPVLANSSVENAIWVMDALPAEIETIYPFDWEIPYPLENIAAAEPDLIIVIGQPASYNTGEYYDQLATIAPVLAGETAKQQENSPWQERLRVIAEVLDLSNAAESVISEYEDVFTGYRKDHPEFNDKTMTLANYLGGDSGIRYDSPAGSDAEAFFLSLGFSPNPLAEDFVDEVTVSSELVSRLDADVLIVLNYGGGETGDGNIAEVLENPLFTKLDAVQNDRFALITSIFSEDGTQNYSYDDAEHEGNLAWSLSRSGPLGSQWAAEQLIPILNELSL